MSTDTCKDCEAANTQVWGAFVAGCKGCQARAVARSPQCFEAARKGHQTAAYRDLLARLDVSHDQVLHAMSKDYQSKRKAA